MTNSIIDFCNNYFENQSEIIINEILSNVYFEWNLELIRYSIGRHFILNNGNILNISFRSKQYHNHHLKKEVTPLFSLKSNANNDLIALFYCENKIRNRYAIKIMNENKLIKNVENKISNNLILIKNKLHDYLSFYIYLPNSNDIYLQNLNNQNYNIMKIYDLIYELAFEKFLNINVCSTGYENSIFMSFKKSD